MNVQIGEIETTVRATDSHALFSESVLQKLAVAVADRLGSSRGAGSGSSLDLTADPVDDEETA
jgi:hypothetical protein